MRFVAQFARNSAILHCAMGKENKPKCVNAFSAKTNSRKRTVALRDISNVPDSTDQISIKKRKVDRSDVLSNSVQTKKALSIEKIKHGIDPLNILSHTRRNRNFDGRGLRKRKRSLDANPIEVKTEYGIDANNILPHRTRNSIAIKTEESERDNDSKKNRPHTRRNCMVDKVCRLERNRTLDTNPIEVKTERGIDTCNILPRRTRNGHREQDSIAVKKEKTGGGNHSPDGKLL